MSNRSAESRFYVLAKQTIDPEVLAEAEQTFANYQEKVESESFSPMFGLDREIWELYQKVKQALETESSFVEEERSLSLLSLEDKSVLEALYGLCLLYMLSDQNPQVGAAIQTLCQLLPSAGFPFVESFTRISRYVGDASEEL